MASAWPVATVPLAAPGDPCTPGRGGGCVSPALLSTLISIQQYLVNAQRKALSITGSFLRGGGVRTECYPSYNLMTLFAISAT